VSDQAPLHVEALRRLTPEQLASDFHHNYEMLAPHFGYRTRPETAVPWEQVPEANKALMIAVIRAMVFEDLNLPAIVAALEEREELRRENTALKTELDQRILDYTRNWKAYGAERAQLRQRAERLEKERERENEYLTQLSDTNVREVERRKAAEERAERLEAAARAEPQRDGWVHTVHGDVRVWECGACGFTFLADHTDDPAGGHSCPACFESRVAAALAGAPAEEGAVIPVFVPELLRGDPAGALNRAIEHQDAVHPDGYPATRDGIFLGITTAIHELEREAIEAWRRGRCKCPTPRCDHHDWRPVADELLDAAAVIMRCWRSIAEREATRAGAPAEEGR